jgi:lipoprotein-anchoring transpeptidase ErfK/SrfK
MGIAERESVNVNGKKSTKWYKNWKIITPSIIIIVAFVIGALNYYQANHFNTNITINGIKVGGLTADDALSKLKTSVLKNEVYLGEEQILNGKNTKMGFTDKDLLSVEKLLKSQQTFIPSSKSKNYSLLPNNIDQSNGQELKKQVEVKLTELNKGLKAPQDAKAHLENGNIVISKSVEGEQYDVASLLKEYEKQEYTSVIHLNPILLEPIKEDSEMVKNEEKRLKELLQQTVNYKVQDKDYSLKASDLIKNASVTKDLKVTIDTEDIKKKITEINHSQSTLDKDFTFNTHSGSTIAVKGEGYGWALDVEKETAQIGQAFETGETSVSASNIYGKGWNGEGYGYEVTANSGIGGTYAEISLAEQRMWIYKDGKEVFTTNVVTGNHGTGEDTLKGVWYVLYKRSPYVLEGNRVGGSDYAIEVNYWVPFTNSGQGFHDASWRTNWSSNAYLTNGSGGCVNVSPSVMKQVYDNINTYDPVVIY